MKCLALKKKKKTLQWDRRDNMLVKIMTRYIYTWVIINRTLNIIIFHNFIIIYVKNHNYKYCTTFNFINNAKGSFL